MGNLKKKLLSLRSKLSVQIKPAFRQVAAAAMAVTALTFGTGNTAAAEKTDLTTVYHVYVENKFVGTVADKGQVETLLEEKTAAMEKLYEGIELELGEELSYVPEQVFQSVSQADSDEVVQKLDSELSIQANAYALVIGEKEVAHVKDQESAEKAIRNLKLDYVTEEQLAELEEQQEAPVNPLPPLKENETRLLDVSLSEEVSMSEAKVDPKQLLSVEEAVNLFKKGTLEEKSYKVEQGDVLSTIASRHDLTLKQLISLNAGMTEDSVLKPGQELKVTFHKPFAEVIVSKEVYQTEEIPHEREVVEDASMFKGDTKVKQEGKDGLKGITYGVSERNGRVVEKKALQTTEIQKPVKEIIIKGTKVIPSRGEGSFVWPAGGGYISSQMGYRWGKMHKGIDIARPGDLGIKAADNGKVVSAGYDGGYGNKVVIDHQNGYRTVYAHLASISVNPGQTVERGSKIGVMGRTGDSTGVHLHFEVYKNGKLVNPMSVLKR
ncbi:M23 family metallopeptidase [Bacillus sp. FJAT-27251]|uniref:M23 family metallopeptidase n=1 Tax=Bacillus sp. FJAT-27251 TaxID=1684142 RepID=UPI0006A76A24|nr:M23 family metallopeptidase [Bacillus sp. FJAT-27251]